MQAIPARIGALCPLAELFEPETSAYVATLALLLPMAQAVQIVSPVA
jgi:hypothetical protein